MGSVSNYPVIGYIVRVGLMTRLKTQNRKILFCDLFS